MSQETDQKKNSANNNNDQSQKIEKAQINEQINYSNRIGDLDINKQNAKPYINDDLVKKPDNGNKGDNNTTDNNSAD